MATDSIVSNDQGRCAECGQSLPKGDLARFGDIWICARCKPVYVQRLQEGVDVPHGAIWRSGKKLVMRKGVQLPDRCIKCNAPSDGPGLVRKLSWHPPAYYFIILINLIIYAVVAMIISKRATVTIGLCANHQQARRKNIGIAWGLFVAAIACFVGAAVFSSWLVLVGILAILGSLIFVIRLGRIVYAQRMDKDYLWLGGICAEYLAELPEWTGKK